MFKKLLIAMTLVFATGTTFAAEIGMNANGKCVKLCDVDGIKKLVTATGYEARLFAAANTVPSLVIEYNGQRCYGDLVPGAGVGVNIKNIDDKIYHTWDPGTCTDATFTFVPETADDTYGFQIGAIGKYTINWGDGVIEIKEHTANEPAIYTHTYTDGRGANAHTIGLDGTTTGYVTYGTAPNPAISFRGHPIKSMDGCLGCIFPTLDNGEKPNFYYTFSYNTGLNGEIPPHLFDNIKTTGSAMFYFTFNECRGLTGSIPPTLFSEINGPTAIDMFAGTFSGCSGLTGEIPAGLFGNIYGTPQNFMFAETFYGCRGLTSIGDNLFGDIDGPAANNMFEGTFNSCISLTGPSATVGTGAKKQKLYERWPDTQYGRGCYKYDNKLTDYAQIPSTWGGDDQ